VKERADLCQLVLDALDQPILAMSPDLKRVRLRNAAAARLFPRAVPPELVTAARDYLQARLADGAPHNVRVLVEGRAFYMRLLPLPDVEVMVLVEEVLREVDAFKLLHARHGISAREYQVLTALRLGKTNRQIAGELGLAAGTVNVHVHHLLTRFDVPNRTRLVRVVEELLAQR
jgi:DNA-binding CsgD family transcriptional regulator